MHPACVEDERLLVGIVAFLNAYFRQMHTECPSTPEDKDLRWMLELLLNQVRIINTSCTSTSKSLLQCSWKVFGLKGLWRKHKVVKVPVVVVVLMYGLLHWSFGV